MIKKFNEYAGQEMDREEWPSAPTIPSKTATDREKIEMIKDLYVDCDRGKISHEEMMSKLGEILGSNRNFPGTRI